MTGVALPEVHLGADGLVPVVAQDAASGDVLMVAWANAEALARTAETGLAHFWSRRRGALWRKGEASGHVLRVVSAHADCDGDTLLLVVEPAGPTCHTGTRSCFGDAAHTRAGVLAATARAVADRARTRPAGSYVARLLGEGPDAALRKVGEEAIEVLLAARGEGEGRLAEEAADLVFHLMVVLEQRAVPWEAVADVLERRRR